MRRFRAGGFTLIEMLVVLVIMGLVYSLVPPLLGSGRSGAELKAAARQLAAGLRKARSDAVTRQQEVALTVDVEHHRFSLSGDKQAYRLPEKVELNLYTARSELSNEKTGAIRFYPDGSSTGGRITVTSNARKFQVDVNWMTGQVSILD